MDALRKPSIRKLNPGMLQSDDEVREQFVVRRHELAIVLEVLRGNIEASSCQHVLVVAPRGRGKTMLLARVAAELHTDAVLSEHLLPVRFMEESQEIFTLADFWLETLFHLARESAAYDPELAREVRETHADLVGRWNEETLGERALAAVLRAANRLGKQLVLMVENLQALCDTVDDDFGWKLREVLQSEPQIMLLATATSRFKGLTSRFKELDDAQQPFFELFRTVDLEPLSTEECQELWRVISGDEVSEREMRPLEILTGGSPRLLVIVAGFGQHRSLLQLMEELVTLIDEHTEYFRSNMEVLPKTERRVYIAVIDLWQPSTTGQIATRARLDVRTVSTMLGRLTDRGAVIWKGSGKKRQYVAAERLYSIYYKLRRERDEAAVVQNLIRFMVAFYSEDELAEMSGEFIAEAAQSPAIREGIERVVAELPELNSVFSGMRRPAMERPQPDKAELSIALEGATLSVSATVTNNGSAEQLLQELLTAFDGGEFRKVTKIVDQAFTARSENWFRVPESWIAHAFLMKARAYRKLDDSRAAIAGFDEVFERFASSNTPGIQTQVAWALSDKGEVEREQGELTAAIATYDKTVAHFGASDAPGDRVWVVQALSDKGEVQRERGELADAIATYDEVIARFGVSDAPGDQEWVAWALTGKGDIQREQGELTAAIATYEEVIARFGTSNAPHLQMPVAWASTNKGNAQWQLGELTAAIASYDETIARFGTSNVPEVQIPVAWALTNKGDAQRQLGELAAAMATYDEVIACFGASDTPAVQARVAGALTGKGNMQRERGELTTAIVSYEEVVARFGTSNAPEVQEWVAWALSNKGDTQRQLGELAATMATYDEVITRFGTSDAPAVQERVAWALGNKGNAQRQLGELATAIATYDEVITRFGTSDFPQLQEWVAWALGQKGDTQRQLGELAAAMATWDEVIARFGASDAPAVQAQVAWTLSNKGYIQREQGELAAAIVTYDEVIARFGTSDVPQLQEWVAWALSKKGEVQTERGHAEEALHTCEELERRLDTLTGSEKAMFEWQVRWVRAKALLVQENSRAAMEAFRSAYDVFVPDYITVSEMLRLVPDLIALGASVPDLVEILSSDKAKSDTLVPLIVALREYHTGEAERAPEEVREVAADIIERIEQRIEVRALKGGSSAS